MNLFEMTITERLKVPGQFLIREYSQFSAKDAERVINKENKNIIILKGIMQRAESKNGNGRIYNKRILEREIIKYKENFINERNAIGALDHSSEPEVLLREGSHIVTKVWWQGNDVYGEIELLDTPNGRIAESYVNSNIKLGISTRGVGSITEGNDGSFVNDDYQLICWDLVQSPSTQGAYMLREGKLVKMGSEQLILTNENINYNNKEKKINNIINSILRGNK